MSLKDEKKLIKRKNIMEAATELFMNTGFTATAVDEVVKAAGVAKGTFYLYFKDKYDLLDQIVTYKSAEVLKSALNELFEKEKTQPFNLNEKVIFVTDFITAYMCEHKDLTALLDKNFSKCFRYFLTQPDSESAELMKKITGAFALEGYTERQAEITLFLITELVASTVCDAILSRGPFTLEEIRPALRDFINAALRGNKND